MMSKKEKIYLLSVASAFTVNSYLSERWDRMAQALHDGVCVSQISKRGILPVCATRIHQQMEQGIRFGLFALYRIKRPTLYLKLVQKNFVIGDENLRHLCKPVWRESQ